jgi:hypothetical protein
MSASRPSFRKMRPQNIRCRRGESKDVRQYVGWQKRRPAICKPKGCNGTAGRVEFTGRGKRSGKADRMNTRLQHACVLNVMSDDHPGIISAVSAAVRELRK